MNINSISHRDEAAMIGFILQSAENQIVCDKVWHELAFGLESLGLPTDVIRRRIAEMCALFGIESWYHRDVSTLSGGQKQILNLASVMLMQPEIIILDEPTSQLDPIAASNFIAELAKVNREFGTTIIISEHRLEEILPLATKVIVMDEGKIISDTSAENLAYDLKNHRQFHALPCSMKLWASTGFVGGCPITNSEARAWLKSYVNSHKTRGDLKVKRDFSANETVIKAQNLYFSFNKNEKNIISDLSIEIKRSEIFAVLGANGAGKTSFLKLLAGINKAQSGKLDIIGKIGYLPQNPEHLFVKSTVYEDLFDALINTNYSNNEKSEKVNNIAEIMHIEQYYNVHPYDLSGGEKQRLALAKILLTEPEILLLDEPSKALDTRFKRDLGEILLKLSANGVTIIMVSHDIDFCADYATRCALFFDSSIIADAQCSEFFIGNNFYTSSANRISRGTIDNIVTYDELAYACFADNFEQDLDDNNDKFVAYELVSTANIETKKSRKMSIFSLSILCFIVPFTLYIGLEYIDIKKYYVTSLLVLLECMIPFFLLFEKRKPQTRELVLIAVLTALAVASRAIFFMLPQIKPLMAIVIISGIAFGAETGFLVGSLSMLCSNMLFSQGPWTAFQMFAMGLIGFLAGLLFNKALCKQPRLKYSLFGFLAAIIIYGGIMNPVSALLYLNEVNFSIILTYYITGFPMDLVQAIGTFVFLWFGSVPILQILERVKQKYGFLL